MDKPVLESKCTLYLASFHVSNVSGGWLCPVTWSDPNVPKTINGDFLSKILIFSFSKYVSHTTFVVFYYYRWQEWDGAIVYCFDVNHYSDFQKFIIFTRYMQDSKIEKYIIPEHTYVSINCLCIELYSGYFCIYYI